MKRQPYIMVHVVISLVKQTKDKVLSPLAWQLAFLTYCVVMTKTALIAYNLSTGNTAIFVIIG